MLAQRAKMASMAAMACELDYVVHQQDYDDQGEKIIRRRTKFTD